MEAENENRRSRLVTYPGIRRWRGLGAVGSGLADGTWHHSQREHDRRTDRILGATRTGRDQRYRDGSQDSPSHHLDAAGERLVGLGNDYTRQAGQRLMNSDPVFSVQSSGF